MNAQQRMRWNAPKRFALLHGWKLTQSREHSLSEIAAGRRSSRVSTYASSQLGRMFDHPEYYEDATSRRPTALVVHPYRHFSQQEVDAIALQYGVRGQIIPNSWYDPSAQTICFSAISDNWPSTAPAREPSALVPLIAIGRRS
jgi:hypothetical protein